MSEDEKSKNTRKILWLLGMVMVINALSYGIIIPLLYPYATKFGLSPLGMGILFATFSLFQLLATPIIGRMSDKYGRKPMLLGSLFGTGVSLVTFALATTVPMLFFARMLDGITGGNISVAQAVITDTAKGKERTRAFGIIGASFGVGFLLGPALGGILSDISLTAPFWFAAGLAFTGSVIGWFILPETLHKRESLRNFPVRRNMFWLGVKELGRTVINLFKSFRLPVIGPLFIVTLMVMSADQMLSLGFQAYMSDIFRMTPSQIGWVFAGIGVISIVMQAGGIKLIMNLLPNRLTVVRLAMIGLTMTTLLLFLTHQMSVWIAIIMIYVVAFIPVRIMLVGLLSDNSDQKRQGHVLGINQSILSFAQIIGPVSAGIIASRSINMIFAVASLVFVLSFIASKQVKLSKLHAD